MLDHFTIKVTDIEKSKVFYKNLLATLNAEIKLDFGKTVSFGDIGFSGGDPGGYFWIAEGKPQHIHFAFNAKSKQEVDRFYLTALELGGTSNGEPGFRDYHENYYATFIYDLDGYNIEAVYHGE
ncbi:VOC family protein [Isobaculum melis]|uniref:Predicted lactoylglutathione lyase n=1 Tax=Isobaculum melis TaxID=142588 RepID=A0A1H9TC25_9LACT|nr:VOC family protein [Isobaculum melis]SER94711.1 Predicted lactoylglutathione lyase [Isobaculum melis]